MQVLACTYLMPLGLNTSSVGWNLQPEPSSCIASLGDNIESQRFVEYIAIQV